MYAHTRAQMPHFPSLPPGTRIAGLRTRLTITARITIATRTPTIASDVLKRSILPRSSLSRPSLSRPSLSRPDVSAPALSMAVLDTGSLAGFGLIQPFPTVLRKGSISSSHIALEIARYAINSAIAPVYQGDSGASRSGVPPACNC